jgi:hypothetical protein
MSLCPGIGQVVTEVCKMRYPRIADASLLSVSWETLCGVPGEVPTLGLGEMHFSGNAVSQPLSEEIPPLSTMPVPNGTDIEVRHSEKLPSTAVVRARRTRTAA